MDFNTGYDNDESSSELRLQFFFFFDVCRLFVYRSSGRDVLDCLKFRINTILRVCQTENGVSFRSDVTALKSCKDKSGFKLALQRKLSRGHDQVKMFSFS